MLNISQNKLEVGDMIICKGKSWISKGILKVTKGDWSHSAIYSEVWSQASIIEAQANGVNFKLWDVWRDKWNYDYVAFRYKKKFSIKALMLRAFEKCGETKYDFLTFFVKIPFRLLLGKSKYRKNKSKQDDKQICSEFCAYVYDLPQKEITPQELYEYLNSHPDWELVK